MCAWQKQSIIRLRTFANACFTTGTLRYTFGISMLELHLDLRVPFGVWLKQRSPSIFLPGLVFLVHEASWRGSLVAGSKGEF